MSITTATKPFSPKQVGSAKEKTTMPDKIVRGSIILAEQETL
jgi:hypothetical protein